MTKPLKHLLPHYTLLILIFLTGSIAVFSLENGLFRWTVLGSLVALYIIWGVWHHYENKSLTHQVILEYAGISLLIAVILFLASN